MEEIEEFVWVRKRQILDEAFIRKGIMEDKKSPKHPKNGWKALQVWKNEGQIVTKVPRV